MPSPSHTPDRKKAKFENGEDQPTTPSTNATATSHHDGVGNVVSVENSPSTLTHKTTKQSTKKSTNTKQSTKPEPLSTLDWTSPSAIRNAAKTRSYCPSDQSAEDYFKNPSNIVKLLGKGKGNYEQVLRIMHIPNIWGNAKPGTFRIGAACAMADRMLK